MTSVSTKGRIDVRGLTRRFGSHVAVQPLDLSIGPGGVTGLLGPNGSGKSTLLRMLVGIVPADAGRTIVDGVELTGDGTKVRRRVTYVPGEIGMYGELTGRAHLAWLLQNRGHAARERATNIANVLGLPLTRRVRGYSHGMKRQLLLAAALGPDVHIRILDEPTEGLDPSTRGRVLELLQEEARSGVTILLSSHHLGEVDRICSRVLFLKEGELLDEESAELLRRRAERAVRLVFDQPLNVDRVWNALAPLDLDEPRVEVDRIHAFLPQGDPREGLRQLLELSVLPQPTSVLFGELSLSELYRQLYGSEGV